RPGLALDDEPAARLKALSPHDVYASPARRSPLRGCHRSLGSTARGRPRRHRGAGQGRLGEVWPTPRLVSLKALGAPHEPPLTRPRTSQPTTTLKFRPGAAILVGTIVKIW